MKILITGAGGQLGRDVAAAFERRGHEITAADRAALDITDEAAVEHCFARVQPDLVVHCAAWTAVDAAEDAPELCRAVNAAGTARVAAACARYHAAMVYISTDYVFDGSGSRPWRVNDACAPLSVYGQSKLEGENAVKAALKRYFIVRTSWVFGKNGHNFIKTILRLARSGQALRVVDDQFGAPTYTRDLAELLADMAGSERWGVYHAANSGCCSWYELAAETLRLAGVEAPLTPVSSADYPQKARRPFNSRLDLSSLEENGFAPLPCWQDALDRFLKELDHG